MEPNTYCKYSGCTRGKDGGRAHYYSCLICGKKENWRSVACCEEHYQLYVEEVLAARAKNRTVDTTPDRSDMSKQEYKEKVAERSMNEVIEETKEEMTSAGYGEYLEENGLAETIEKINEDINNNVGTKIPTRKMKTRSRVKKESE